MLMHSVCKDPYGSRRTAPSAWLCACSVCRSSLTVHPPRKGGFAHERANCVSRGVQVGTWGVWRGVVLCLSLCLRMTDRGLCALYEMGLEQLAWSGENIPIGKCPESKICIKLCCVCLTPILLGVCSCLAYTQVSFFIHVGICHVTCLLA